MCVCSVVLFCMVSPLFSAILATANGDPTNGVTQCIGLFFMALGLGVESVADWQKNHYKRPHPELYCSKGLFAYMRMPNYLGEILFWIGNLVTTFAFPRCAFLLVCNTIGSFFSISVMIYAAFDLDASRLRTAGERTFSTHFPLLDSLFLFCSTLALLLWFCFKPFHRSRFSEAIFARRA